MPSKKKSIPTPTIDKVARKEKEQKRAKEFIDNVNSSLKKEIEEYLDSEPVINPNATTDDLTMLRYNGDNAKQVMKFCDAYHMDVSDAQLKLWIYDGDRIPAKPLLMNSGQAIIKDGDTFKVVD